MAHVAKYKKTQTRALLQHYSRALQKTGFERSNIDSSRTPQNYTLSNWGSVEPLELEQRIKQYLKDAQASHKEALGRSTRSDANVMADWIITMPKFGCEGREREFFEYCFQFLQERYGKRAIVGGFVHMDEAQPHMHTPLIPLKANGTMSMRDFLTLKDIQPFHDDLKKFLLEKMGVELDVKLKPEDKAKHELSKLDQSTYIQEVERLEGLRRAAPAIEAELREVEAERTAVESSIAELEKEVKSLDVEPAPQPTREQRAAAKAAGRELGERIKQLEKQRGFAVKRVARAEEQLREVKQERVGVEQRVDTLAEAMRSITEAIKALVEALMSAGKKLVFRTDDWQLEDLAKSFGLQTQEKTLTPDQYAERAGRAMADTYLTPQLESLKRDKNGRSL